VLESQLTRAVIELARSHGWRSAHFTTARTMKGAYVTAVQGDGAGFPDLVLVRERIVYAELKQNGKYPTPSQRAWMTQLKDAGAEVHLWHERDYPDLISEVLRGKT